MVAKERDVYGELAWIPNFNVKVSKDNTMLHSTNREFFDNPKTYHNQFNLASITN
jgi:hypothetical protein